VHVRRGDYLTTYNGALYHLDHSYYNVAIERMKSLVGKGAKMLVFSDDIPWCRQQKMFQGAEFVSDPDEVRTMWIMSQYKNYVMSNSTFCWWSVFLG
jgi:hypothetical protein